jgi:hypothetical protein
MSNDTKIYNELNKLRHDAQTGGVYELNADEAKAWVDCCLEELTELVESKRGTKKILELKWDDGVFESMVAEFNRNMNRLNCRNSCKVEKFEHGYGRVDRGGITWYFYKCPDSDYWIIKSLQPIRKIETDNTLNDSVDKCCDGNWIWYHPTLGAVRMSTTEHGGVRNIKPCDRETKSTKYEAASYAIDGDDGGMFVPNQKIKSGPFLTIDEIHNDPRLSNILCICCSFAKWPNAGPGYGERCDKCKLTPHRVDYELKAVK